MLFITWYKSTCSRKCTTILQPNYRSRFTFIISLHTKSRKDTKQVKKKNIYQQKSQNQVDIQFVKISPRGWTVNYIQMTVSLELLQPCSKGKETATNNQHLNNPHKYLHNDYMPGGKACSELQLCSHFDGKWPNTTIITYCMKTVKCGMIVWTHLVQIKHTKFKNSVPTSQRTHNISITKTDWLMLFREIITVYSKSHYKIITPCGQNAVF